MSGFKKFLAINAFLVGTIIIVSGFVIMIIQAIVAAPIEQGLIAFFYTISGIIFWGIGSRLTPQADTTFGLSRLSTISTKRLNPENERFIIADSRLEIQSDTEIEDDEEEELGREIPAT